MAYSLILALVLLAVIAAKLLTRPGERCPECGAKREGDAPICACGWVYEYPDDGSPMEYGDPDDAEP